jgi:hypothetical protein
MDAKEKVRENLLRRMAKRQGLVVHKSRTRDPRAIGYGGYMISTDNAIVAGATPSAFSMNMDEVEAYLLGEGA